MDDDKELLFIWDSIPTRGYGATFVLIVKADNYEKAMSIAVDTLEHDNNYTLPDGIEKIETVLMIADKPDTYYLDRFDGKLLIVYE